MIPERNQVTVNPRCFEVLQGHESGLSCETFVEQSTNEMIWKHRGIVLRFSRSQVLLSSVVHQTVGVAQPVKAVDDLTEALQECLAILVVCVDVCSGVPS
jgi:hypothetical protein